MDQNDNRPVFRQEAFSGRVLEGAVPGEAGRLRQAWGALSPSEGPGDSARLSVVLQSVQK